MIHDSHSTTKSATCALFQWPTSRCSSLLAFYLDDRGHLTSQTLLARAFPIPSLECIIYNVTCTATDSSIRIADESHLSVQSAQIPLLVDIDDTLSDSAVGSHDSYSTTKSATCALFQWPTSRCSSLLALHWWSTATYVHNENTLRIAYR